TTWKSICVFPSAPSVSPTRRSRPYAKARRWKSWGWLPQRNARAKCSSRYHGKSELWPSLWPSWNLSKRIRQHDKRSAIGTIGLSRVTSSDQLTLPIKDLNSYVYNYVNKSWNDLFSVATRQCQKAIKT